MRNIRETIKKMILTFPITLLCGCSAVDTDTAIYERIQSQTADLQAQRGNTSLNAKESLQVVFDKILIDGRYPALAVVLVLMLIGFGIYILFGDDIGQKKRALLLIILPLVFYILFFIFGGVIIGEFMG